MKTLLKTEFGSHLYGTNLPESDRDFKVVYLPCLSDLLLGKSLKNKVSATSAGKNTADDVDTEFVALHTFVKDFVGGQTYALELAFCPAVLFRYDDRRTYWSGQPSGAKPDFAKFVEELRSTCLTSNVNAMVGYCLNQARKYSAKGDRLNEVRRVLAAFEKHGAGTVGDVPVELSDLVSHFTDETHTHLKVCGKLFPFSVTVGEAVERLKAMEASFGERAKKAASMDGADWKALMHACRVSMEAEELMRDKKLTLPFTGERRDFLMAVRQGQVAFDEVTDFLENQVSLVTELSAASDLPKSHEVQEEAEKLLLEFLKKALFP